MSGRRTRRFESGPVQLAWATALCIAAGMHVAAVAAIWSNTRASEVDDALGAPAIEIGLDLTAPHREESDLPPGPEAEDSAASASVQEQKAKVEDKDLPKAQPTETDDPDRVVSPDASKPQKDETPKVTEVKATPTSDSVASEAAAPPKFEAAKDAPVSAAPAQGSGDSAMRVRVTWQKELVAHLNRFKRYPANAGGRRMAEIVVAFTLDRMGHVVSASVSKSSGDRAFDDAALAMMKKADPVPPPPPLVADEGLAFALPVNFRDKHK